MPPLFVEWGGEGRDGGGSWREGERGGGALRDVQLNSSPVLFFTLVLCHPRPACSSFTVKEKHNTTNKPFSHGGGGGGR